MARVRTLLELRTETRTLTDTVGDPHVSDAQLTVWINQGIAELWRQLVLLDASRYAIQAPNLVTTAGDVSYDLEDDFGQLLSIWRLSGTQRLPLDRFNPVDRAYRVSDPTYRGGLPRYNIMGQGLDGSGTQIVFDPDPGTNTYQYWYVQAPQLLASDDDEFDGVAGYEDWIVLRTAKLVFIRQQDPEQVGIDAEMQRIWASIAASAANRDVGRAPRVTDTRPRRGAIRGYR